MTAFDNIRLEKGLYASGDFTGALEKIDPSENYSGTALEGLDAYQRQLKRFDIKVSGAGSDVVDKFFKTSDSAVLFPEYVSRAVRQGMQEANVLPRIVASTTVIDSLDYRSIACEPSDDEKELKVVAEGAFIPETSVKSKANLVHLKKRGRSLVASYEAVRFQRLDLFTVTLRQIGAYIARTQLSDAVDVLINGDGNNNAAANTAVESAGKLTYTDLVNFWNLFDPYELNTIIAAPAQVAQMLGISEFRDAAAGLNFHATGEVITPLGADLIKGSCVPAGKIIGIDRSCALEMVTTGPVSTEYDKLIDRQLERAVISSTAGFARIFDSAARTLTVGGESMITQWSVLSLLRQLTDIGEDEEKVCLGIALSSLERVNSRLKADADRDDVRIAQAAAGLAYYALCVRRAGNSDGVESFKAGDITVKKGADSSLEFAASVRDAALAELTPLLSDDGFFCCGVEI